MSLVGAFLWLSLQTCDQINAAQIVKYTRVTMCGIEPLPPETSCCKLQEETLYKLELVLKLNGSLIE